MLAPNDFPSVRRLLSAAIDAAVNGGASVIDADEVIEHLRKAFAQRTTFGESDLRSEIIDLAKRRGLSVRMGGQDSHQGRPFPRDDPAVT